MKLYRRINADDNIAILNDCLLVTSRKPPIWKLPTSLAEEDEPLIGRSKMEAQCVFTDETKYHLLKTIDGRECSDAIECQHPNKRASFYTHQQRGAQVNTFRNWLTTIKTNDHSRKNEPKLNQKLSSAAPDFLNFLFQSITTLRMTINIKLHICWFIVHRTRELVEKPMPVYWYLGREKKISRCFKKRNPILCGIIT